MAKSLLLTPDHIRNFWDKVDRRGPDDCWLWMGWRNDFGHGRFEVAGEKYLASHLALILTGSPRPPPPRDNALHGDTCHSAACVNPAHLRWGTQKENSADRERLGRRDPARGEGHGMAKLTEDAVRFIRSSGLPNTKLAQRFNLSTVWVRKIKRREAWAHVA